MSRSTSRLLAVLLLALLVPARAQATITFIGETTATAATHWSDGTHTMAWDAMEAPDAGELAIVCGLMLTVATTFVTPTATNITFDGPSATATFDGTSDVTLGCWSGVATGTVGSVTLTTAANTGQAGTMRLLSFASDTGFTAPGGATPCQESASTSTSHDADCSGITTTAGTNSVVVGLNGITSAGAALTLDASYTALTGIAEQMAFGYYLTSGQETVDFVTTSASNRNSATVQLAWDEDPPAGSSGAKRGLGLYGSGL